MTTKYDKLLTPDEFATRLNTDEQTVRTLVQKGALRAVKLPGLVRIPESEYDRLLQTATNGAPPAKSTSGSTTGRRTRKPRVPQLYAAGLLTAGDEVYVKGYQTQPDTVVDAHTVNYQGQLMSWNDWGKQVTGWKALSIYGWVVQKKSGLTLDALRPKLPNP
jgi:excisionase family DNA binding protein